MINDSNDTRPTVCVLMSTYNGQKYLRDQINSILQQEDVRVRIIIRDDGSEDSTLEIIEEYKQSGYPVDYIKGKNIGACNSFLNLLWSVDLDCQYYAFSDQDDIWFRDKLSHGVYMLENTADDLAMYSCAFTLEIDNRSDRLKKIRPSFGNALIECISPGCTIIFTRELLKKIREYEPPQNMYMHDWFLYLFASDKGSVIVDEKVGLYYRQHEKNAIGATNNIVNRYYRRIKNFSNMRRYVFEQAMEYRNKYDPRNGNRELLEVFLHRSLIGRFIASRDKRIYRQNSLENVLYKLLLMVM